MKIGAAFTAQDVEARLKEGEEFNIPNFGKFKLVRRSARKARNPHTGEVIDIPERLTPRFVAYKKFKEAFILA